MSTFVKSDNEVSYLLGRGKASTLNTLERSYAKHGGIATGDQVKEEKEDTEQALERINGRFARLESDVSTLSGQLSDIEDDIADMQEDIADIKAILANGNLNLSDDHGNTATLTHDLLVDLLALLDTEGE